VWRLFCGLPDCLSGPSRAEVRLDRSALGVCRQGAVEAEEGAGQGGKPGFVELAAAHLRAGGVVGGGPAEEILVLLVHGAAGGEGGGVVAVGLAGTKACEAGIGGKPEVYHQVELRDERIAPAAQATGEHPGRRGGQSLGQQLQAMGTGPNTLERRVGGEPEELVDIEMGTAPVAGEGSSERGCARS
jgi:hypothetical protein